jgi:hypothetical protein
MGFQSAAFRSAAVVVALLVSGCFNQPKDSASASAAVEGSAASSGDGAAASADTGDSSRTVNKAVTDPALNMTAFNIPVPAGWKFTGMLERVGGCHGNMVPADGLAYTILAPDGVTAIERLPGTSWGWATDGTSGANPKCGPVRIGTAAEYLLNIAIPNLRPDAKNINVVPLTPATRELLAKRNQQAQANAPQGMRVTVDAAQVRLQYPLKGRPVEEVLWVNIQCRETEMPAFPMLHRAALARHICNTSGLAIRRAPLGKLDPLIDRQFPPPQINTQWDEAVSERMRQQFAGWQRENDAMFQAIQNHFKDVTNGMIQRGKDFQAAQDSSFQNAMARDRATQGAIDHSAQMQVRDSLNRQDFIDPNTGRKIETSNQFTHNWISSDGQSVALNSDATFDPNGTIDPVRQSWTELIPVN